jgi:hypothetical protein
MKKVVVGLIVGILIGWCFTAYGYDVTSNLIRFYETSTGGKVDIYDKDGKLNAKIGGESGNANNTGGTINLFNHAPIGKEEKFRRVELGIANDAGVLNLIDKNSKVRIQIQAETNLNNPVIAIRDEDEKLKTYLSPTEGYINNQIIVTDKWLQDNGYIRKSEVQKMIKEAIKNIKK